MSVLPIRLRDRPTPEQLRAIDPSASAWVAASAGTGKTKVLTDRVLCLMLAGCPPERILCLTFTKAAAAEMANRISERLGEWTMLEDADLSQELGNLIGQAPDAELRTRARRLFAQVLDAPGGMNIQTIHAFCQSLLGRFPLEAGVAPHFQVMDDRDASEMLETAKEEILAAVRDAGDGALAQALDQITRYVREDAFTSLMASLADARGDLRRLIRDRGSVEKAGQALRRKMGLGPDETGESVIAAACEDVALDLMGLRLAATALAEGSDTDADRGFGIADWLAAAPEDRVRRFEDYATFFLVQNLNAIRKTLITKGAAKKSPGVQEILEVEAERLLVALRHRCAAVAATATTALLRLGQELVDAYDRHKESMALLDFDDLILTARAMLAKPEIAPWVLFKLDGGLEHVLIDEAQDTNPEQWAVVEALTDEFFHGLGAAERKRTVFAVGDAKQSIYSFQKADPVFFRDMRDRYAHHLTDTGGELRQESLIQSFRSTRAVLQAVDAVFARSGAADGVALDGEPIEHKAARAIDGGLVEVWAPIMPKDDDEPPPWKPPVERARGDQPSSRLARVIARRIEQMVGKEMLESRGRKVRAGDIMVLVRRRTGFVEELVRELKRRNVGVAGVDRMVLVDQLAVMDLMALGRFLLQPEDDLTLATVLKGPLVGLDEDALFRLAHGRKVSLWRELRARKDEEPAFAAAETMLSGLLAEADYMPPFEFYSRVLGAGRGREKLAARLGPDALDPIAEFLDLTLTYERGHVASLEGFLHWVETGAVEIKRDLEQDQQNAVRVMTAHGSKGLQAPIVFLPDTLGTPRQGPPLLWPEERDGGERLLLWPPAKAWYETVAETERARVDLKRDQEHRRLLYVAMTRAEDRLYVCGWHPKTKAPDGCWYNLIRDGVAPIATEIEDPFLKSDPDADNSKVLRLVCKQEQPAKPWDETAAPAETTALPAWARQPAPDLPEPIRPFAPSRPEGEEPAVASPFAEGGVDRFKRGRLIHRLLQSLPDLPEASRAAAARAFLSRPGHGLEEKAIDAIASETLAVLNDPLCREVFGPGSLAEVPLVGQVGGRVLSARLDRLVVGANGVSFVDFKTDRPPPVDESGVPEAYLRQMAAYRAGLAALYPGKPLKCLLLLTWGPRLMEISAEKLAAHAP
jgi:ATP-dependent helicase/nuclease subunit A